MRIKNIITMIACFSFVGALGVWSGYNMRSHLALPAAVMIVPECTPPA